LGLPIEKSAAGTLGVHEVPQYDYDLPWQTRAVSIFCPDYSRPKDAEAASAAGDVAWFQRTGCIIAKSGRRVVLIEAPTSVAWRGRIYPERQGDGIDLYFSEFAVLTFGGFYNGKGQQIDFATRKEAEQWLDYWAAQRRAAQKRADRESEERLNSVGTHRSAELQKFYDEQRDIPRGVRMLPTGRTQPLLGPALLWRINSTCTAPLSERVPGVSCWMMYPPPSR
jgi:hypothetical protein